MRSTMNPVERPQPIDLDGLVELIQERAGRTLVGITGPPGVGKSTNADALQTRLGASSVVVPMDGFHLAQAVLTELGLADVKGAPQTFDAASFVALLERVRLQTDDVVYAPAFDRAIEEPIAGSIAVTPAHRTVIVEGNYLLLDCAWAPVADLLDVVVYVDGDDDLRRRRLIDRHVAFGKASEVAREWVERSDEANARLIATARPRADYVLEARSDL